MFKWQNNAGVTLFKTDQQKRRIWGWENSRKQCRKDKLWYKVKWIDYSSEYDQWILEQDLDDASELCEMYDVRIKKRHQRWNTAKTKARSCIQLI